MPVVTCAPEAHRLVSFSALDYQSQTDSVGVNFSSVGPFTSFRYLRLHPCNRACTSSRLTTSLHKVSRQIPLFFDSATAGPGRRAMTSKRRRSPARRSDDAHATFEAEAHALAVRGNSAKAFAISRSWYFCTLPAGVFGKSAMISTRSGQYCFATLCSAIKVCTSPSSSV
jgi:hypothetical protein